MARRFEFDVLVERTISHSFASLTREVLFLPLEHKIHIFSPPCNILYVFGRFLEVKTYCENQSSRVPSKCLPCCYLFILIMYLTIQCFMISTHLVFSPCPQSLYIYTDSVADLGEGPTPLLILAKKYI